MMKPLAMCITVTSALSLAGCKDHPAQAQGHEALHAQLAQKNAGGAGPVSPTVGDDATVPRLAVGTPAKCPVSGEDFTIKADTVQVTYAGKRYAFCCADCQPTFAKNPAKYAKR
jgi:YHS domain-containing protein